MEEVQLSSGVKSIPCPQSFQQYHLKESNQIRSKEQAPSPSTGFNTEGLYVT